MKKINVLKNNYDFDRIIKNNKPFVYKHFLIYKESSEGLYHFGISVSKHITNAVGRNKIKRQIRDIIDDYNFNSNFNCIIIVRKSIMNSNYQEIKKQLDFCFSKLNIIKEK
ncbi:MAG: ribonuclease P protein component [Bacilli bacterium]|nr:ribonuclease P protein component [Bacilli bacterium]